MRIALALYAAACLLPMGCRSGPWYRELGFASEAELSRPEAVPGLVRGLGSADLEVVRESSQALARLGEPAARALAVEVRGPHATVAAWALGEMGARGAAGVPALAEALSSPRRPLREAAAQALGKLGTAAAPATAALVRALASDPEDDVRREIPPVLAAIGQPLPEVMAALERAASGDKGYRVRMAARRAHDGLRFAPAPRPAPVASRPAARAPIVAVFDIADAGGGLSSSTAEQLTEYLTARLAAAGLRIVPRDQIRARLAQEKTKSYRPCVDQTCQIELGRAVAAEKSLACRLLRLQGQCALTALLYDLRSEATERAATVETGCAEAQLLEGLRRLASQLAARP